LIFYKKLKFIFNNLPNSKLTMPVQQQHFIQILIETGDKLSLEDFFKSVHQKFYSNYDISFMKYFLELTTQEGEFVVHHEKLIEYGVMTSGRSNDVNKKLDALELIVNEDYRSILFRDVSENLSSGGRPKREVLRDVSQNLSFGGRPKKVYMLTPEAFKKCLMRAQRRPRQKVDPVVYCDYYLLLEKTYKLYTDYEKQLLNKQLEQKDQIIDQNKEQLEHQAHQLEQKDHQLKQKDQELEQQAQQLEDKNGLVLRLNEMLIDSSSLPKTHVIYIATSSLYASQNTFKVGGVESLDKLESRLCTYNSRSSTGDPFYYADWFLVHNYREIENRLKDLIGRFREKI